jgi:transcriptional regulator with XRE-family HTH domain
MKIFCLRLCALRKEINYTQRQMAERLGIKQPSYVRYEIGTSEPTQEVLIKIADIFNVSLDYLLGRSEY